MGFFLLLRIIQRPAQVGSNRCGANVGRIGKGCSLGRILPKLLDLRR